MPVKDYTVISPPESVDSGKLIEIEKPGISKLLRHEGSLLLLVMIVLVLSFALPYLKSHGAWVSIPCWFHKITGIPCLACGLTRSFVLTAHGQWSSALEMHLLGPALFFLTWAFGAYLVTVLSSGCRVKLNFSNKVRGAVTLSVIAILTTAWIIKILYFTSSWK
ncbi:MAG: DUF2752 domain-containing protein [Actinobacteria bacterium]|nr:DUF2752 domain-containing protein [Actinomycetota bacterium]